MHRTTSIEIIQGLVILKVFVVAICSALVSFSSVADVIKFKNGDILSGTLTGISGGNVTFKTDYVSRLLIPQELIDEISTENKFEIKYDSKELTQPIDNSIAIDQIVSARQHVFNGFNPSVGWRNRLETGFLVSTGNSDLENYHLSGEAKNVVNNRETIVKGMLARETVGTNTVKNQIEAGVNTKLYYQDRWFGSANLDSYRDPLKNVDMRLSASLGIGHRFWEHTHSALVAELGVSRVFEEIKLEMDDQQYGVRWHVDYRQTLLGGRVEAFHSQTGLGLPTNDEFVVTSSNGLRYLLSDRFDVNFRTELQHESDPAEGKQQTDISYIAGLGLSF